MALYQGRAMRHETPRRRLTLGGRVVRVLQALGVIAALVALAHLPWQGLRARFVVVTDVKVEGAEYLDPERVAEFAGLARGADALALDLDRARQELLLHARVADATIARRGLRGVTIKIAERRPVLLVQHGEPWELDSAGVLLAPLAGGAVADVPLLTGADLTRFPEGTLLGTVPVRRGLEWVRALSARDLQLGGRLSEIDVSEERSTALLLMNGTRVLSPAWPPGTRRLSALRVVLADLEHRGIAAQEVDLRFDHQVIVRPVEPRPADAAGSRTS
jgi:cell division protein FtsQ